MARRTYNPDGYEPETQAAMKELLSWLNLTPWTHCDIADIIEKAVVTAKQLTEEKVRAACAAVAEAHLTKQRKL